MRYDLSLKQYVCMSCGLAVTFDELAELREKARPIRETDEEKRKRERKEYLKWWLSKKG